MSIHTWIDGYLAIRDRAYETRGSIELDSGARWPRTTGEDVIAIAAMFDDAVHRHGTAGVIRRWDVTLAELERDALQKPHATYAGNRAFWSSVETVAVFLDDLAIETPSAAMWDALLDEIGRPAVRNASVPDDGPFGHFDVKTYDDLYLAEYKFLRDKRGADNLPAPPGVNGVAKPIPRATNADVIELVTYWSPRLDHSKRVMGRDAIDARWEKALADIDKTARTGKPEDVYANNNEFWRVLGDVAIYIAAAGDTLTSWELVKESVGDSVHHLPENLASLAEKGADLVASAAHAAGKVANEAGKGLFAGFGTPLLIGGGLLGLFLISRHRNHEEV